MKEQGISIARWDAVFNFFVISFYWMVCIYGTDSYSLRCETARKFCLLVDMRGSRSPFLVFRMMSRHVDGDAKPMSLLQDRHTCRVYGALKQKTLRRSSILI